MYTEKIDKVLEFYVRLAEETGYLSINITLNIHGLILTGRIITANQYFDEIAKIFSNTRIGMTPESQQTTATVATPAIPHENELEDQSEDDNVKNLTKEEIKDRLVEVKASMISELTGEYMQFMDKMKQEEDHSIHDDETSSSQSPIEYIHLNDVIAYPKGSDFPYKMNVWRGKLSAVDGFCIADSRAD